MKLVELLPRYLRLCDELSADETGLGNIEKWVNALEALVGSTRGSIDGMKDLVDLDTCPSWCIPLITQLLGLRVESSWPEAKRRMVAKAIVLLWHSKGTRHGISSVLNLHGYTRYFPWELWKSKLDERFDYALEQDYQHPYKAARIDIRRPEDSTQPPYHGLLAPAPKIDPFRPVHVLIRHDGDVWSYATRISDSTDIGSTHRTAATVQQEPAEGMQASVNVVFFCTAPCQNSCQTNCTTGCMTVCMLGPCEGGNCQLYCLINCQNNDQWR